MNPIGWNLHIERCAQFDHDGMAVFSINIVTPYGPKNMETESALEQYRSFLFPHEWSSLVFHVYAGWPDATRRVATALATSSFLDRASADEAAVRVRQEVWKRSRWSRDTFSTGEEAFSLEDGTTSLAHVLTPLTHWPAGLSDEVLKRAFYVELPSAGLPADEVVLFPEFGFSDANGPQRFEDVRIETVDAARGLVRATSGAYSFTAQLPSKAMAPAFDVSTEAPGLSQGTLPALDLRALVATHLHPLKVLAHALASFDSARAAAATPAIGELLAMIRTIDQGGSLDAAQVRRLGEIYQIEAALDEDDMRALAVWTHATGVFASAPPAAELVEMLRQALVRLSGCGWDRMYGGATARQPHLFELLAGWNSLSTGLTAIPAKPDALSAARARDIMTAALAEVQDSETGLALIFDGGAGDSARLLAAWHRVAHAIADGANGQQFLQRWLYALAVDFWPKPDQQQAVQAALRELARRGINAQVWFQRNVQGTLDQLGDRAPDAERLAFWEALYHLGAEASKGNEHDQAELSNRVSAAAALLHQRMAQELATLPPLPAVLIRRQVQQLAEAIVAMCANSTPVDHEPGLSVQFDDGIGSSAVDTQIRGYAIALRGGARLANGSIAWDRERSQWITDTAFNMSEQKASLLALPGNGGAAWLHETYGSTTSNGHRVISAGYRGQPLLSVPYRLRQGSTTLIEPESGKADDYDGFTDLEFLWPGWIGTPRPPPLLGYGLHYQGHRVPIANAGGILSQHSRLAPHITRLKDAKNVFDDAAASVRFRSRQRIAAPDARLRMTLGGGPAKAITLQHAYELSEQTRSAIQHVQTAPRANQSARSVALLTDASPIWAPPYRARGYQLVIRPPRPVASFIERWLNADIVRREIGNGPFTHDEFGAAGTASGAIQAFRDAMLQRLREADPGLEKDAPHALYHPAVSAIGVDIAFNDGPRQRFVHPLKPLKTGAAFDLDVAASTVTIGVRMASGAAGNGYQVNGLVGLLSLKPRHFVEIRLVSLIDQRWVSAPDSARFHALDGFEVFRSDTGLEYIAAGSTLYHFEGAPEAPPATEDLAPLRLELERAGANLSLTLHSDTAVAADWLHAMRYQPYDFHWAGYPIDFPAIGAELAEWLPAHANANTERPDLQGLAVLETSFGGAPDDWHVGRPLAPHWVAGLTERGLRAGLRPATQIAYVARPVVRFRKWLDPQARPSATPLRFEAAHIAAGLFVAGVAPELTTQRLPVPALRMAVPLTATYWPGENGAPPQRQQNGNLLIFDDAIRRTDDMAAVGGVGEVLEVDLINSHWESNCVVRTVAKIGPNPIFHMEPAGPIAARLHCHPPIGLSYDQSDNGLVAQTGIIVTPDGGDGQWLLAEVRTRRLILPEVLQGTALAEMQFDTRADYPSGLKGYRMPLRQDGKEYVPLDFCVDVGAGQQLAELGFYRRGTNTRKTLNVPLAGFGLGRLPADGYRLLVSWHKGRWNTAVEWRAQILLQVRAARRLEWETLGHKRDCADNASFIWHAEQTMGDLVLESAAAIAHAALVPMSDYTPGLWLNFIGGFGAEPVDPANLALRAVAGNRLILQTLPGADRTLPACIALPAAVDGPTVEFNCLLVYRPLLDMTCVAVAAPKRPPDVPRSDAGALVGAWHYDGNAFAPLDLENQTASLAGCWAYLCTFQHISAASTPESATILALKTPVAGGTRKLIELMFPDQTGGVRESTVRMLPKVLGQITIL